MRSLLIAILIFIVVSCTTTKYVDRPVLVETVRTEYVNQLYKDSIFVHDSIDRFISGDTVHQYKYKYIYKYFNRTDTVVKTDSIEIPVEIKTTEVKEVNRIKGYQSFLMCFGFVFILILVYKVIKFIKTILNKGT
jgi:hypothetical protein|nr:MAG TPA: hypothetical protein [Crassvirales sp.]DAU61426.1 MAG TPA: hypothetical protein [Crassvirales sp.]